MLANTLLKIRPPASVRLKVASRSLSSTATMARSAKEQIAFLQDYSACDVSDALLKIQKPAPGKLARAGYLADLVSYAPAGPFSATALPGQPKVIGLASTLKLMDKNEVSPVGLPDADGPHAIPKGSHWADVTDPETVLVIEQPRHQTCAAIGGIMAQRMKVRGVLGCVVSGRVRDLTELQKSQLPVWAAGRSTVGQGGESKVHSRNTTITVNDVEINPGDMVFCDPVEGVVTIPQDLIEQVIELMPKLVAADDKVKADVAAGSAVQNAFKKHRG